MINFLPINAASVLLLFLFLSCSHESETNRKSVLLLKTQKKRQVISVPDSSLNSKFLAENPFETKELKLLITNNFNSYFVYKGEEAGLEFELLKLYAKDKGWSIKLQHVHDLANIQDSLKIYGAHLAAASFVIPSFTSPNSQYSFPLYHTNLVLVQNKNGKNYNGNKNDSVHPNIKTAYVVKDASYLSCIWNDSIPPPENLIYKYAHPHATKELLIEEVAEGKIECAISDKHEAEILKGIYPFLDISQIIRKNVPVGFVFNPSSIELKKDFDLWLSKNKKLSDYQWTLIKYEKWPEKFRHSMSYALPALTEGQLSLYDQTVKKFASEIEWDWKLLSALIFQESRFDSTKVSGAGARGLMQIMPNVGLAYASLHPFELFKPLKNISAGTKYISWISKNYFKEPEISEEDRIKFILASYNAGPGHIQDARALARKHGLNPNKWDYNTEKMILAKSNPVYFRDPVVKHGYCRGKETATYVKNIMNYFQHYSNFYPEDEMAKNKEEYQENSEKQ